MINPITPINPRKKRIGPIRPIRPIGLSEKIKALIMQCRVPIFCFRPDGTDGTDRTDLL